MTIEFQIHEQDFLAFQLFTASKSARINKKKRNGWILLTLVFLVISLIFYLEGNHFLTYLLLFYALVTGIFYPTYFKWRYKTHYRSYIRENYSKRFGLVETIEITADSFLAKDKIGEGRIKISEIDKVDETNDHFFIKVSTGHSLIIPKKEVKKPEAIRDRLNELGINIDDETNWQW